MIDAIRYEAGASIPAVSVTVTRDLIDEFGDLSNDHNPVHFDDAFARGKGFKGAIAHGAIAASFLLRMMTEWLGDWPVDGDDINITFVAPVLVGDCITARGNIESVEGDAVKCDLWCENQDGIKVVVAKARVAVRLASS